jgi:hypothetical protein
VTQLQEVVRVIKTLQLDGELGSFSSEWFEMPSFACCMFNHLDMLDVTTTPMTWAKGVREPSDS